MKNIILTAALLLAVTSSHAAIQFEAGWDDANNSNVRAYTEAEATEFLREYSTDLAAIIDSSKNACILAVVKGCHQPNAPHFRLKDASKSGCKAKSIYLGTKDVHIPC